jgi:hypothetical protein
MTRMLNNLLSLAFRMHTGAPGYGPAPPDLCHVLLQMQAVGILMLMTELAGDGHCSKQVTAALNNQLQCFCAVVLLHYPMLYALLASLLTLVKSALYLCTPTCRCLRPRGAALERPGGYYVHG